MSHDSNSQLCYLEAGQLTGPCGGLQGVTLSTEEDEALGTLDGVVIDPSERRIRYFVVQRRGWLGSRRFLLSADRPAQITKDRRKLRLPVEPDELTSCEEFDAQRIPRFSDDHLLTALFCTASRRVAADADAA
jgi:hypothetical protein